MLTNQAVRQNVQNLTDNTQEIQNIKEGSSDLVFSMSKTKSFLSKYPGFSKVFFNINTSLDNYDIFLDKMVLLSNYGKPGLIREVDLRNFGITNPAVKEYARSSNLNGVRLCFYKRIARRQNIP